MAMAMAKMWMRMMVMVMMSMILEFLVAVSWSDIGPFLIAQFRPGPLAHPRRSHLGRSHYKTNSLSEHFEAVCHRLGWGNVDEVTLGEHTLDVAANLGGDQTNKKVFS